MVEKRLDRPDIQAVVCEEEDATELKGTQIKNNRFHLGAKAF